MNKSNNKDNKNYPNSYGDNLPNESSKDQGNDDISKNSKYLDEFNQFLEFQKEFQIRNDELREQLYDEEQKKRKVIRLASDINKELVRDRYYQLNQQAKRKGKRVAFWRELPGNVKRETKKFIVKLLDPNVFVPLAASLIIYFETNKIARKVEEQDMQIKAIIEQPAFKPAPKRKVATYVIIAGTMAVQLYMQVCTKSELHNTRAQLDQANQILQQTKGELNVTRDNLDQTKEDLKSSASELNTTRIGLASSIVELSTTKSNLEESNKKLIDTTFKLETSEKNLEYSRFENTQIKEDAKRQISKLHRTLNTLNSEVLKSTTRETEVRNKLNECRGRLSAAIEECKHLTEVVKIKEEDCNRKEKELVAAEATKVKLEGLVTHYKGKLARRTTELAEANEQKRLISIKAIKAKRKLKRAETKFQRVQQESSEQILEIDRLTRMNQTIRSELEQANKNREQAAEEANQFKQQALDSKKELRKTMSKSDELALSVENMVRKVKEADHSTKEAQGKMSALERKVRDQDESIRQAKNKYTVLEKEIERKKGESKENSARHSVLIKQKAIQWEKLPNPIFSRLDVVKQTIGHRRLDTTSAYVNKLSDQERQARISQLN